MEVKAKATIPVAKEKQCKNNDFSLKIKEFTKGGES